MSTPHQQIDHVISIFKNHGSFLSFEELNTKVKQSEIVVEPSVLRMILEKLERDKHVFIDPTRGSKYYSLSFEGSLFVGYEAKASMDALTAEQQMIDAIRLTDLENQGQINAGRLNILTGRLVKATWWAFSAAAAIVFWQIFVYLCPPHANIIHVVLQK